MLKRLDTTRSRLGFVLAAGGLVAVGSLIGSTGIPDPVAAQAGGAIASSVVTVDPTRVLDTRFGTGLSGPILSNRAAKLQITGPVPARVDGVDESRTVVPAGATGVLLNVTALRPDAAGFISIRPGTASGEPSASNLNFTAGQAIPNAVTSALAPDGTIDIWYGSGTTGARTGVLIDIVGYTTETTADVGATGPQGPEGPAGPAGPAGSTGAGDGFVTSEESIDFQDVGPDQILISMALPAGDFIVSSTLIAVNFDAAAVSLGCQVTLNDTDTVVGGTGGLSLFLAPFGGPGDRETVSMTGGGNLAEAGIVQLRCGTTATTGTFFAPTLTAIQLSSVTEL